jgi:hypothetical protein
MTTPEAAPTRASGLNFRVVPFVVMAGLPECFVVLPAGAEQPSRLCPRPPMKQAGVTEP